MSVSLQIQSVIYHNQKESLLRALTSLANAVRVNQQTTQELEEVTVCYGDASSSETFTPAEINQIRESFLPYFTFNYRFFGENTGTAKGHNLMGEDCVSDYMMIMNPDVVVCPNFFGKMFIPFFDPNAEAGMVEARQAPIEHPKEYNKVTFETEWATTACAIFSTEIFRKLNGFDHETFFLYCDDLDFSWRVRMEGKKIYYRPDCVVYHAKRLSSAGQWQPTSAEVYYSMEAALLLAYKWSYNRRVALLKKNFSYAGAEGTKVLKKFEELKNANKLPLQLDPKHKVAKFVGDYYTEHRFAL